MLCQVRVHLCQVSLLVAPLFVSRDHIIVNVSRIIKESSYKWKDTHLIKLPKVEIKEELIQEKLERARAHRRTRSASEVEDEILHLPRILEDMMIEDLESPGLYRPGKHKKKLRDMPLKLPEIKPVNFQFRPEKRNVLRVAFENQISSDGPSKPNGRELG